MQQSAPFPRQWRQKYTRSKVGCLSCRGRRKRCDLQRPVCTACARNNLGCHWASPSTAIHDPNKTEQPEAPSIDCLSGQWPILRRDLTLNSVPRLLQSTVTKHLGSSVPSLVLFEHYIHRTGHILGTRPSNENIFLTSILPLAVDDGLILNSIVAVSGAHLLGDVNTKDRFTDIVTRHYCLALSGLRSAIQSSDGAEAWLKVGLSLVLICHHEVRIEMIAHDQPN